MTRFFFLLLFGFAAPLLAQRNWASREEYELCQQAAMEPQDLRRIDILLQWKAAYPNSEFAYERLELFALAYAGAGRHVEAFAHAKQMVQLQPEGLKGAYLVAVLAPALETPSREDVQATEAAAQKLLARPPSPTPANANAAQTDRAVEPDQVVELIRKWRRGKRIRTAADEDAEIKAVAGKALAWVRTVANL